jgi:hypothetical protein
MALAAENWRRRFSQSGEGKAAEEITILMG